MKVAYFTALRRLELRDDPEPRLERPGDVLLRIEKVGVCGSDVHYYTEGRIGNQLVRYPATVGHECSATVLEAGSAVTSLRPGQRVAVDPAYSCGACDQCRAGRPNTCRKLSFMACPGEAPGALCEFMTIPAANCVPIPDTVSLDEAVLAEPLSIGLYASRLAQQTANAKVAILGSGPIGLCVLLSARAAGPCTSYVTDLIDARLETARQCGADWTGNPQREDVVAAISQAEPLGLDTVFECSGAQECLDQAVQLLKPGGELVIVGIPSVPRISLDPHEMRRRELTVKNVRRQNDCVAPAVRLVAEGRIDVGPLVTHHFPLEATRDAFELVAGYRDGVIKAIIDVARSE
jgi:L-iditol 2-dehydrogenase